MGANLRGCKACVDGTFIEKPQVHSNGKYLLCRLRKCALPVCLCACRRERRLRCRFNDTCAALVACYCKCCTRHYSEYFYTACYPTDEQFDVEVAVHYSQCGHCHPGISLCS